MKKVLFLSMMLTAAMAASAQMKVAPELQKGMEKVYTSEATMTMNGQKSLKSTTETKYTVTEATADGYVIDVVTTQFSSDAAADDMTGQILSSSMELVTGVNIRVATNQSGKVEKILNFVEVSSQLNANSDKMVDKMFQLLPQLSQAMSKEDMKKQLMSSMTEERILEGIKENTSPLALNGKTIMTGAQEDFVSKDGLKMKRMYFLTGKNVVTNSTLNMTKEELKAFIIAEVEKTAPEQAEMVKQNIDMVMGSMKFDMKETASYELQGDGWVKSITSDVTTDMMGQSTSAHTVVTVK
ncbi:MAG: hypothetical protein IJV44_00190 [Prevotella sp.]|nr:hypothetical protein [Prevotella sp.]